MHTALVRTNEHGAACLCAYTQLMNGLGVDKPWIDEADNRVTVPCVTNAKLQGCSNKTAWRHRMFVHA